MHVLPKTKRIWGYLSSSPEQSGEASFTLTSCTALTKCKPFWRIRTIKIYKAPSGAWRPAVPYSGVSVWHGDSTKIICSETNIFGRIKELLSSTQSLDIKKPQASPLSIQLPAQRCFINYGSCKLAISVWLGLTFNMYTIFCVRTT